MKLVAGLGNPGEKYRGTRHNVGFDVVDLVASRRGLGDGFAAMKVDAIGARWRRVETPDAPLEARSSGGDVWLVKPLTFMNLSGPAIGAIARYYDVGLDDLLVVCDDVNLPLGRLRARGGGSDGGHNGLRSIAEALGTMEYPRLRVGVGRGDARRDLANHVLSRFEPDEMPGVEDAVTRAADAVEMWVSDGLPRMMNAFNRVDDHA